MSKNTRQRLLLVAFGVFAFFSLLIAQFYSIQIINGQYWEQVARKQHFFVVHEPFKRGTFWSNAEVGRAHPDKPQRFVLEIEKNHLFADPQSIPAQHRDAIADYLTNHGGFTGAEASRLKQELSKKSRSRKLASWIDQEKKEELLSWWNPYSDRNKIPKNALYFVSEYQRSYPFGKLLGQVLHTVQSKRDEITKQAFPTGGLELFFDSYLRGKQGKKLLKRSPRHSFETGEVINAPEDGADVYLTINHTLQAIAEEEIENGVKRCKAKAGWAVMMEPHTGEILALAQYPFFYPSKYQEYFNDSLLIANTRIQAVTDAHEPGSVVKPITAAVALLANKELTKRGEPHLFDPNEKMPVHDSKFPGRSKPLTDVTPAKYLNLDMGIQKSSNIYMARLVERIINRLGNAWYRDQLEKVFGFGVSTGIELPSESSGLLPRPGRFHPNGALEWSVPTPFSLAMGHNLQLNTIQLLRAWAVLANGGYFVQPTLVRKILKNQSEILLEHDRENRPSTFPKVLDDKIITTVLKAVKYVTKPGGSGRRGNIWGYTEAGKTGTSHKIVNGVYSQSQYVNNFIGFAPVSNPAFVLIVVMDEPEKRYIPGVGHNTRGSISAAPVFKAIATRSLEYLGITPDDPYGYPYGDPRYNPQLADWMPETQALEKKYDAWNK